MVYENTENHSFCVRDMPDTHSKCELLNSLVVEEWVVVRRGWLVRGFLDALTIGGPGGAPRPIELQAHDPLRYVGDMLAWVHQALPSEREAAQTLFAKCSNIGGYFLLF